MKHFILLFFILISSLTITAQQDWEFANSTPQKLVKSHFYFVEGSNKDLSIAVFTFESTELSTKIKWKRIVQLHDILKKLKLNIDNVSDRRKGIIERNKYILTQKEKSIYLVRNNRKWYYSKETVANIPKLYNKYVLGFTKQKSKSSQQIKKELDKELNVAINDSVKYKLDLSTPYNTILSHLVFTDDSLFDISKASQCIDLSKVDSIQALDLAIKLKQVYLATSRKLFDFEELSRDTFYLDSASNLHRYWPNKDLPELYLEKEGDKWLYSKNTAALIASVHTNMYAEDAELIFHFSDKFKELAAHSNLQTIGKLQVWQILMIIYFIFILIIIYLANKYIVKRLIYKIIRKRWKKNLYQLISSISFLIALNIIRNYGPSFAFPIETQHIFLQFISISKIFVSTLLAVYIVNTLVVLFTHEGSFDNRFGLVFFLSLLAKVIIFTISLLFVINALEYNLINFLAGLSIGGFALALGAQDTIKNFFGSLMIFADDSFNAGDWIETKDVSGTVEKIGLRSTRVRTFHNSLVTVPNSNLSDNNIDNMGKRIYRRYSGKILLDYNTPQDKIEEFIAKIKEEVESTKNIRKDFYMVYISNLDKLGIEIMIYVFFKVNDWDQEMAEKHKLLLKVLVIKNQLDINFAKVPIFEGME